jgi:EmrB/QacA subfamily drug resistance transporter
MWHTGREQEAQGMTATTPATSRKWVVLVAMTLANAMVLVDQTGVPLALPSIMAEFGLDSQSVQWVLNGSLLPLAGLLVLGGRLGDLLGRRRVFVIGSLIFAVASAFAGFAPTFEVLIAFRVLQGAGGALMLPTTIAIVSAAFAPNERGRALGTMGGAAAVAGALGPVIGGGLTSVFGWRAVLLVTLPLAIIAVLVALRVVGRDAAVGERPRIDLAGTILLSLGLVGLIFGLAQSQDWGWGSPAVIGALALSVLAMVAFVMVERRLEAPLLDLGMLRRYPNYLGATISQGIGGMLEMGFALLLPLLLILNLGMEPALAGLAIIPTTLPMVLVAPLAGRWYDRVGGRRPLVVGFLLLALFGLLFAGGVFAHNYWLLLPALLVYGVGLALVLTVNDPVSLDTVPERDHGQASGVSATAEQFGGALGIAVLYLIYHITYLDRLVANISASPLADLTPEQAAQLKADILSAEQTGLKVSTFDPALNEYLPAALDASNLGMAVAGLVMAALSLLAAIAIGRLVRAPAGTGARAKPR